MFEDPWEELTFRNVGNQGKIFNAVEDRFLLCLTHLHGYVAQLSAFSTYLLFHFLSDLILSIYSCHVTYNL